ncbi:YhfC family intramembrane metalloprotease, partial [Pseudomonas sp. SWRI111]
SIYIGVSLQIFLAVIVPVLLMVYLQRKKMMSWRSLLVGILIFIVFSQILEKIVHFLVLAPTGTELRWSTNPYIFALYGGLAAGVFE